MLSMNTANWRRFRRLAHYIGWIHGLNVRSIPMHFQKAKEIEANYGFWITKKNNNKVPRFSSFIHSCVQYYILA
jgi:hypothetical protein